MPAERRVTDEQLVAVHRLHVGAGLSINEIARQVWERYGYASPKSAAVTIRVALKRRGLPRRPQRAATRLALVTHGQASRKNPRAFRDYRNEYRRRRRAQGLPA